MGTGLALGGFGCGHVKCVCFVRVYSVHARAFRDVRALKRKKSTTKSRAVRHPSPRRSSGYGALMSVRRRARPKARRPADGDRDSGMV